jgi:hypothetical protein
LALDKWFTASELREGLKVEHITEYHIIPNTPLSPKLIFDIFMERKSFVFKLTMKDLLALKSLADFPLTEDQINVLNRIENSLVIWPGDSNDYLQKN